MDKANFDEAIALANKILEENYVQTPPVQVDDIARNYHLKIIEADFKKFSGAVAGFIDPETSTIYVNKDDPDTRKAFTIAHELGHYLLHKEILIPDNSKYRVLYRKPLGQINSDPLEKEANCFAAHLLVPKKLLDKYKDEDINVIAKIFGVSDDVIGFRLKREYGRN